MGKPRLAATLITAATLATGGLVAVTAQPAAAACTDTISVGRPYKSGSYVRANSSICAPGNWRGESWIERWRGLYWDEIISRSIQGGGTAVARQYPLAYNCSGDGTYTYRGGIWATNTIFTPKEHSVTNRFSC
jgi:hypothetical protein